MFPNGSASGLAVSEIGLALLEVVDSSAQLRSQGRQSRDGGCEVAQTSLVARGQESDVRDD